MLCFVLFFDVLRFLSLFSLLIIYYLSLIIYYYQLSYIAYSSLFVHHNFTVYRVEDAIFTEFCYRILPSDAINK